MLYNLTNVLISENAEQKMEVPLDLERISNGYESYPVLEKTPVKLVFTSQNKGEVLIEGACQIVCEIPCGRCLKAVPHEMNLVIHECIKESEIADSDTDEEYPYLSGYQLDIDALVSNEIMINWPMKVLCKDTCKGICKVCGKDLNEGDCGCDTFVPDPRLAVLKDIFNVQNKEV